MSKKEYKSKEEKYFLNFLPKEVFDGMNEEEHKYYKLYRDNHFNIHRGNQRIEKCKKEIEKLKQTIRDTKLQISGNENGKGWKDKTLEGYSHISHLSENFEFWCSIEKRPRKSQSLINKEREEQGLPIKKPIRNYQTTYSYDENKKKGGKSVLSQDWKEWEKRDRKEHILPSEKPLKVNFKYYIRVESKLRGKWLKNMYLGSEENVRSFLQKVYPSKDWKKVSEKELKKSVKVIYIGYSRYQIHKTNPNEFCKGDKKHTSDEVILWCKEMGDKIFEWMDK